MKTKRELAQTYFPQITADSAVRKLTTGIKNCKPLTKQLAKTGYRTGTHTLTDRQIGMIYDYLGEPWERKGNIYFFIFFYWYFITTRKTLIYLLFKSTQENPSVNTRFSLILQRFNCQSIAKRLEKWRTFFSRNARKTARKALILRGESMDIAG